MLWKNYIDRDDKAFNFPRNNAMLNGLKNAENTSTGGASSYTTDNYLYAGARKQQ